MPVKPYRELFEDRQEKNFTVNLAWNPSNVHVGTENFAYFIGFSRKKTPAYLFSLIPSKSSNYNTRNTDKITPFHTKHNFFKNSFFPSTVIEWNKLDPNLRSAATLSVLKRIC